MPERCPRCGSGNIIGYMGEWECMDCGYRFKPSTQAGYGGRPSKGRGGWIAGLILALILGMFIGYLLGYPSSPPMSGTVTITQTIMTWSPTTIEKTHTITSAIEVTREKTVTVTAIILPTYPTISERRIIAHVGETIYLDDYEVSILSIKEAKYLKFDEYYFKPKEGERLLVLSLKISYRGEEIGSCPIWRYTLVTDKGWAYGEKSEWELERISSEDVTEEVRENVLECKSLPGHEPLAPNTWCEGDILFTFPRDENPIKIFLKPFAYYTVEIVVSSTSG